MSADELAAGVALDRLIAERVMNLTVLGEAFVRPEPECGDLEITTNETEEKRPVALDPEYACECDTELRQRYGDVLGHALYCGALMLVPEYSDEHNREAALAVVDRLGELGWWVRTDSPFAPGDPWEVFVARHNQLEDDDGSSWPAWKSADTLPLAVCRAALAVMERRELDGQ